MTDTNVSAPDGADGLERRLAETVAQLEYHRETHVQWRDCEPHHHAANPKIGGPEFHAECVKDYDRMIASIEAMANLCKQQAAELARRGELMAKAADDIDRLRQERDDARGELAVVNAHFKPLEDTNDELRAICERLTAELAGLRAGPQPEPVAWMNPDNSLEISLIGRVGWTPLVPVQRTGAPAADSDRRSGTAPTQ